MPKNFNKINKIENIALLKIHMNFDNQIIHEINYFFESDLSPKVFKDICEELRGIKLLTSINNSNFMKARLFN